MKKIDVYTLTIDDIRELKWDDISGLTYTEREVLGRTIYDAICKKKHSFTGGQFDSWDASSTGNTYTFNIEIKFRFIDMRKKARYDREGYWLEKKKYDPMIDAYNETGSIPYLITFLPGGYGYIWNLLDLDPVWEQQEATSTTADGSYGKTKKLKTVYHPLPCEGKAIRW